MAAATAGASTSVRFEALASDVAGPAEAARTGDAPDGSDADLLGAASAASGGGVSSFGAFGVGNTGDVAALLAAAAVATTVACDGSTASAFVSGGGQVPLCPANLPSVLVLPRPRQPAAACPNRQAKQDLSALTQYRTPPDPPQVE
ncbi:hypothetical protein HQ394_07770 [Defluviicoccus vanus]|uniref:Uncharacterized protein n=2 Tax=Defluviicoccus vanus TaxID=111831 RepID=A0A7H1N0L0_9PROT|nr:hypothetical protein HQ394_07770 [Defluviicoccus vanus]